MKWQMRHPRYASESNYPMYGLEFSCTCRNAGSHTSAHCQKKSCDCWHSWVCVFFIKKLRLCGHREKLVDDKKIRLLQSHFQQMIHWIWREKTRKVLSSIIVGKEWCSTLKTTLSENQSSHDNDLSKTKRWRPSLQNETKSKYSKIHDLQIGFHQWTKRHDFQWNNILQKKEQYVSVLKMILDVELLKNLPLHFRWGICGDRSFHSPSRMENSTAKPTHSLVLHRQSQGCRFLGGTKCFFWDTTFPEGGAYFGIPKTFFGIPKTFLGLKKLFWVNFFWFTETLLGIQFFWDSKNFFSGYRKFFRDTKCFFRDTKSFSPETQDFGWPKIPKHHKNY